MNELATSMTKQFKELISAHIEKCKSNQDDTQSNMVQLAMAVIEKLQEKKQKEEEKQQRDA
jgi:hypothetical protein